MRAATLVVPGSLAARTGGSLYDRSMAEGLRSRGWSIHVLELQSGFPWPSRRAIEQAAETFARIPAGTITLVDGLALGALPEIASTHSSRLRLVALVHLPLAAAVGLECGAVAHFEAAERRALESVALAVVSGRATLALFERHGLSARRIVIVEPGTRQMPLARGSNGLPLQLLCVAALTPGKGHVELLAALAATSERGWHLTCAGSLARHPATVERVRVAVRDLGLGDRVSLVGELDEAALERCYGRSDLFVLATLQETYGMAVAEALAHGLPIVATSTGAIPDLVGERAGVIVAPGDIAALSEALSCVVRDAGLRARCAEGARLARQMLPTWDQAAERLAAALESIAE